MCVTRRNIHIAQTHTLINSSAVQFKVDVTGFSSSGVRVRPTSGRNCAVLSACHVSSALLRALISCSTFCFDTIHDNDMYVACRYSHDAQTRNSINPSAILYKTALS
jgi:hypothetical protein